MTPPVRPAVRALVIDESLRVLLFRGELPDRSPWWFAPGGAVERDETERHLERFYLVHVTQHDVDTSQFEPTEAGVIRAHRWWNLSELRASQERFSPERLAEHLEPLLQGILPAEPVQVGA